MTMLFALGQTPDLGGADGATAALRGVAATVFVLGLLLTLAWLVRRGTIALPVRRGPGAVQIETSVALGDRRSLVVVTVDGRRLLLGLTPTQVALVTELSAAPAATGSFAASVDRALQPTELAR
jgi:flagellar biosynthetic protein FliO